MRKQQVAAIVVTYNRKKLLKECIKSLLEQTAKPDIYIIDNNRFCYFYIAICNGIICKLKKSQICSK